MDINQAMQNPENIFKSPEDVLASPEFTMAEKVKILESWAYDIQELEKADEENMPSRHLKNNTNYTYLRQIKNLLLQLEQSKK